MFNFSLKKSAYPILLSAELEAIFTFCQLGVSTSQTWASSPFLNIKIPLKKFMACAAFFMGSISFESQMFPRMFLLIRTQFKIFNGIIQFISIYMMDLFAFFQRTTNKILHYLSVFSYPIFVAWNRKKFVAMTKMPATSFFFNHVQSSIQILTHVMFVAKSFATSFQTTIFDRTYFHENQSTSFC